MANITNKSIVEIFNRELDFLVDGISNSGNPYHFFYLSTFDTSDGVESRTVVLRHVDTKKPSISFNADSRSPKVKHLISNTSCSALFYDNARRVQIRAKCDAYISHLDDISKEVWKNTPLQSRKCYMGNYSPSSITSDWQPNIPKIYMKRDPERSDSEKGFENFCVVRLQIKTIDVLELHHNGHIRFKWDPINKFTFLAP